MLIRQGVRPSPRLHCLPMTDREATVKKSLRLFLGCGSFVSIIVSARSIHKVHVLTLPLFKTTSNDAPGTTTFLTIYRHAP